MAFSARKRNKKGRSRGKRASRRASHRDEPTDTTYEPQIHTARESRGRGGKTTSVVDRGGDTQTSGSRENTPPAFIPQQDQNAIAVKQDTLPTQTCQTITGNTQSSAVTRYSEHVMNDNIRKVQYTTVSQFLQLCNATPHTIAKELQLDLKSFQKVILNSQKVGSRNDDMYKIIVIMLKLAKIGAVQILSEAFNSRSHQFCSKLQQYVTTIKGQNEFETVVELFNAVLKLLPQACNFLPVNELIENINKSSGLKDDVRCISLISTYQNEQRNNVASTEENYSEYKTMSILPLTSEINNETIPLKLRPNIVEGCYDSWEHYYDTQFKLLKEDFVASLRRGICDFRKEEEAQNTPKSDIKASNISDIRVYDNVTFTGLRFSNIGITLTIQFDCSKLRRVNWEHSKRLIYGSLLCFSCNNFETVMFASVVERDSRMLQKGKVTVKMESNEDILYLSLNTNDYYTMIESQAHYESYYHILHSLQTAESDVMPFTDILINANCFHVQPPAYMCSREPQTTNIKHLKPIFNMSGALGMNHQPQSLFGFNMIMSGNPQASFDISKPECWPSVEHVELDRSQLEAIRMALTRRVSVIQGPPGTGKTYIGLKIVQALLNNHNVWDPPRNSPLLVVCYTNHALDQFLEGIIDLSNSESDGSHKFSIARVGGRCKSEKVEKFNIKNIEIRKKKVPKCIYREKCKIRGSVERLGRELDHRYSIIKKKYRPSPNKLMEFIAPIHLSQICSFVNGHDDSSSLEYGLELWLSCKDMEETDMTVGMTSSSDTCFSDTASMNDNVEENSLAMSKVNVNNTISVVSQAEIAEDHRMIDEPATVFRYKEAADHALDDSVRLLTSKVKVNLPTAEEFLSIPEGPLTPTNVSLIDDIFRLSKADRHRLYDYWKEQYIEKLCNHLRANFEGYAAECNKCKEATQEEDFCVLDTVDLIGMTTTGAAKYQHIIQKIKPKIIIVEEAAEVLESHIVSCLTAAAQQLILIGDHKQLRPSPNEYYLTQKYNFDISLFERLILAGIPHATLQKQHRMRPEIAGLVCPSIYDTLENHESVLKYENIQGVMTNLHFFNHKHPENSNTDTKSYSNTEEARLVVGLCDYFLKQDYSPSQITVLTTYTGQLLTLKSLMPRAKFEGVKVTVVDNFQGEENDIIILSLVRSNKNGIVGFLKIENRICVALSRAKKGFYCFGNFDLLRGSCGTWETIVQYMEQIGKLQSSLVLCCSNHPDVKNTINTVDDFKEVPNGGCNRQCNVLLDCGHFCTKICHLKDRYHKNYICKQPCTKTCINGHPCLSMCYIDCPPCMVLVRKIMPKCGHEIMLPCSYDPQDCMCSHPYEIQLSCGHLCAKVCGRRCTRESECRVPSQKTLPCNHSITLPCCVSIDEVDCQEQVLRYLPSCGHEDLMKCCESVDVHKCQFKVEKIFPNCKHSIALSCSTPIDEVSCLKEVFKQLPCGHKALMECSKEIDKHKCQEKVLKKFPNCEHSITLLCSTPIKVDEHKCQFKIEKQFPNCEHSIMLPCSTPIDNVSCLKEVSKQLPCGHKALMECSKKVDEHKCQENVIKRFPNCEHSITLPCIEPIDKVSCLKEVFKQLPCGHKALMECSKEIDKHKCLQKVLKKFPNCEHSITLLCSTPIDNVSCLKEVSKQLLCGHKALMECSKKVDEHKCQENVMKRFPNCEHSITLPCIEPIDKVSCLKEVSKPLSCGHEAYMECSKKADEYKCQEKVTKKFRNCEHSITLSCSTPIDEVSCLKEVFKQLPCGHKALMECSKEIDQHKCQEKVMKKFPNCGHSITLLCSTPINEVSCLKKVSKQLPCGHEAIMECSKKVDEHKCQFKIEKQFPNCEHSIMLPCSTPIDEVSCLKEVSKQLPCGHKALMKCSKKVDKHKCQEKIMKRFLNCEHSITLPCIEPIDKVSCLKEVSKPLSCGHKVLMECSKKVGKYKCQEKIKKKFPNCEHSITLPCSTPINVSCEEKVLKTLSCGHTSYAKCYIDADKLKCRHTSKVTLECGHTFTEKCGRPIGKCSEVVSKKFPLCGHKLRIKCCDDLPQNCTVRCKVKLLCGHQCTGNCTECYQGRMHKACLFQMFPLPCGHHTSEPCTSMKFPPCEYNCEYSCAHHNCTHPCSQPCNPCKQPCSWVCKHYKCIKECHEICDRPRCDEPCKHKLQCRHLCIGICGEWCPRVCKVCTNQKSKFQKLYAGHTSMKSDNRYIQLSCNHLFEVKELDQLLDEQFKECTVEPLVCPACRKQIRFSHRYGNMIKEKKKMIRKLHDTMNVPLSEEQRDATIKKVLNFVPTDVHANYSVSDTPLVSLLKVSSLFTHQHNLIIENEADLYACLKDMYRRYPEMSTSLQEVITFFEKAPPSAQKSHDVISEALRIFLLQIISNLTPAMPQTGEDHVVLEQIAKKLRVDQPRLSVSALTDYFNRLQIMAESLGVQIDKIDLKYLQSTKAANFTNGVWTICSNGHLFCKPRDLKVDKEMWQCPNCLED